MECPECKATAAAGARVCGYCGGVLPVEEPPPPPEARLPQCPRCRAPLLDAAIGAVPVRACWGCEGLWLGSDALARLVADRAQLAAVVRAAPHDRDAAPDPGRPAACPECGAPMRRGPFDERLSVVVDRCAHGAWFDRDELRLVAAWLLAGRRAADAPAPPTGPTCAGCGRAVDPAQADITPAGLVCTRCALAAPDAPVPDLRPRGAGLLDLLLYDDD